MLINKAKTIEIPRFSSPFNRPNDDYSPTIASPPHHWTGDSGWCRRSSIKSSNHNNNYCAEGEIFNFIDFFSYPVHSNNWSDVN